MSYPRVCSAVLAVALLVLSAPRQAEAAETIRFATLAPKNSSWGKVFKVWKKVIHKKTGGQVDVRVYFNAVQGNEQAMVSKLKTGQIDGAALSSTGLSHIHRDVQVLQLPGVVNSWELLDMVRGLLGKKIERKFEKQGILILGWGDVGLVRQMSKGFAVRGPADLKGRHPAVWRNEPMGPILYSLIGGVVPVPTSVPEVLPQLRSGTINIMSAPALATEQLQWAPFLDHVGDQVVVTAIGATVMRKQKFESLPADTRKTFFKIQKRYLKVSRNRIRRLDRAAYKRLRKKMTIVRPSVADKVAWYELWLKAVRRMRSGIFSKPMIDEVLRATGKG